MDEVKRIYTYYSGDPQATCDALVRLYGVPFHAGSDGTTEYYAATTSTRMRICGTDDAPRVYCVLCTATNSGGGLCWGHTCQTLQSMKEELMVTPIREPEKDDKQPEVAPDLRPDAIPSKAYTLTLGDGLNFSFSKPSNPNLEGWACLRDGTGIGKNIGMTSVHVQKLVNFLIENKLVERPLTREERLDSLEGKLDKELPDVVSIMDDQDKTGPTPRPCVQVTFYGASFEQVRHALELVEAEFRGEPHVVVEG